MTEVKKNRTSKLGNVYYSQAPKATEDVFSFSDRKRVADQIVSVLSEFLGKKKLQTLSCLDIGCATGVITYYLSSEFKDIVGIEIDPQAVKDAKKNFIRKNLKFLVGNGEKLPFKNDAFDVVICNEVYSYTENPEHLMREINRVLKPQGICYFVGDNLLYPIENQYKLPLLHYLPDSLAKLYLNLAGYKKYYLGHYKTYWQLKKLCNGFIINDYTLTILKNPRKYKFVKLYRYKKKVTLLPQLILFFLSYFLPTYIFVLKKSQI